MSEIGMLRQLTRALYSVTTMSDDKTQPVGQAEDTTRPSRLIVQRVQLPSGSFTYRLIVYGDACVYKRSDFDSLVQLREVVRSVIPELDFPAESGTDTQILLSIDLDLSDRQLCLLGVL